MSEPGHRKYSLFPKPLANCLEPLTRPVLKAKGLAGSRLLEQWENIVGPALAQHTVVEKLAFPKGKKTGGTLTIAVENGFATELHYMQPLILERLAVYFGYHAVARIVISHSFTPEEAPPKKKSQHPRVVTILPDNVTDRDLREALQSLADALATPRI